MRAAYLLVLLAACGADDGDDTMDIDCTKVTGADTFVVGLEKMGGGGTLNFKLLSATPAPPARGDNTWIVQITNAGAPLEAAQLKVTPFMPSHQHGSPIQALAAAMPDAGQYKIEPVNLWMPGVWETTIRATAGATTDSAVYKFCIE